MAVQRNNAPVVLKYVAIGLLCASVVLVILGVYFYQKEDDFLKQCRLITCKVTGIEEKRLGKAYIEFTEVNGNYKPFKYYEEYDASESELSFKEGETYEIYYYAADISKSEPKNFFINHITSFVLLIIGFSFMLDAPIMFFVVARTKKQQLAKQQFGIKDEVVSE